MNLNEYPLDEVQHCGWCGNLTLKETSLQFEIYACVYFCSEQCEDDYRKNWESPDWN